MVIFSHMAKVVARTFTNNYGKQTTEDLESMLRRFKRKVEKEEILEDMRKHEYYKSPSVKKREKHENALKRAAITQRKLEKIMEAKSRNK